MLKPFATWKYALIIAVVALGSLLALPNVFGQSPIVQMQFEQTAQAQQQASTAVQLLEKEGISVKRWQVQERSLVLYFDSTDTQINARDYLKTHYPQANIAINLQSNTPAWLSGWGFKPMNLGLDLRGGVSFLLQVDSEELFTRKSAQLVDLARTTLTDKHIDLLSSEDLPQGGAALWFADANTRNRALDALLPLLSPEIERLLVSDNAREGLKLQYSEVGIAAEKRKAAEQNRLRMATRVNSLGVAEPSIQVVGDDRILIELPGIQDVAQAKEILGSTATLEFYMADEQADLARAARERRAPFGRKLAYFADGTPIVLHRRVVMSGEHIIDAAAEYGHDNPLPQVSVVLDAAGGAQMNALTAKNIGKPMATVYVEYLPREITQADGSVKTIVEKKETVVNSATIMGQFGSRFQITGVEPMSRAQSLAATLRAGSLVAPVYIIQERTIGPSAGAQNIDEGIKASLLGLFLVAGFMLIYYRKLGVWAVIALSFNLVLLIAALSLLGATLTLPGIVGIVLTLGMAVDANVLIYERIREELGRGLAVKSAVRAGFDNALSTITDANITTLIVALLLFSFGAGPIKGFAVTLSLGVITSMFSAIYITRALIEFFLLRQSNPQLKV